ncbi:MAG: hypothetical protein KBG22_09975 [Smithella sp.]|nr:hypothetical protein [Smithella sp.]
MSIEDFNYVKPEPHPFKKELRRRKITLWMLRRICHIPESQLSRYLNGIDEMPNSIESMLKAVLYEGFEE